MARPGRAIASATFTSTIMTRAYGAQTPSAPATLLILDVLNVDGGAVRHFVEVEPQVHCVHGPVRPPVWVVLTFVGELMSAIDRCSRS